MPEVNSIVSFISACFILVLLIECTAEFFISLHAAYGYRRLSAVFMLLLFENLILSLSSGLIWIFRDPEYSVSPVICYICECLIQISYYGIMVLFLFYVAYFMQLRHVVISRRLIGLVIGILALTAVLWCISSYNGMFHRIAGHGIIIRGPYYWVGQIGGYVFFVSILLIVIKHWKILSIRERLVLTAPVILPCIGSVLRFFTNQSYYMSLSLTLSVLVYYSFVHIEQTFRAKEKEGLLADYRIKLMLSQIRPHFLFNTLNSIYVLCEKDPEVAQKAIGEFSEYLRGNFEGLENETVIPFSREIEHVRHYLNLEKMRFGSLLHVIYDLDGSEFMIPPLTLQPLAENAVKHGIMRKKEGGVIHISSRESKQEYVVRIADSGVGFDPDAEMPSDDRLHIGLKNVKERLWQISQAVLEIESTPGKGTIVIVHIPR